MGGSRKAFLSKGWDFPLWHSLCPCSPQCAGSCSPGWTGSGHLQPNCQAPASDLMQVRLLPACSSLGPKSAMQSQEFKHHQLEEAVVVFVFNNNQLGVVFPCLLDPESFRRNQVTLSSYMGDGVYTDLRTRNMPLK